MNKYLKEYIRNRSKTKTLKYHELKYVEDRTSVEKSIRSLLSTVPFAEIDDFINDYENEIIKYLNTDEYIDGPRWRKGERTVFIIDEIRKLKSYKKLNKKAIAKLNNSYGKNETDII